MLPTVFLLSSCSSLDGLRFWETDDVDPDEPKQLNTFSAIKNISLIWELAFDGENEIGNFEPGFSSQSLFFSDSQGTVSSMAINSGNNNWSTNLNFLSSGTAVGFGILVVSDIDGNVIALDQDDGSKLVAEEINIQKNYKIDPKERKYPVFMFSSNGEIIDYYIFPMFGNGLWDWISGFIALDKDLNQVVGVAFDHKTETPGLGARISSDEIQDRYKGKKIFNELGDLVSIKMLKKENNINLTFHEVDGMSGATITANGLNDMLKNYLDWCLLEPNSCYNIVLYYIVWINIKKQLFCMEDAKEQLKYIQKKKLQQGAVAQLFLCFYLLDH